MKRKSHPDALSDISAQRRRTRSSGPLLDTQPLFSTSKTRTSPNKRSTAVESANARSGTDAQETSSLKENEAEGSDDADELNLSPSRTRHGRSARRVVMDSVELTTPSKRRLTHPPRRDTTSPTPALFKNCPVNHAPASLSPSGPSRKRTTESPRTPSNASATNAEAPKPTATSSPIHLPRVLPPRLLPCLNAQKRAILAALQNPPDFYADEEGENNSLTNTIAAQQLFDLLTGTVTRGEGNSCLVLGPRGSGKTRLVEHTMTALPDNPIIIRLSGWTQLNDRFAMREIARQLTQQTGRGFLSDSDADELDADDNIDNPFTESNIPVSLPPPSQLPALISVLPTLSRPTIVVLDAFDLFALHTRQSLLYCLLDTVQSCRAGHGNKGVAIVGITTRVDTINLLEKRVKSRFSGRTLRTAPPPALDNWLNAAHKLLSSPIHSQHQEEWVPMWTASVDKFLTDPKVIKLFHETFALFKDARMLNQLMANIVLDLSSSSPFPGSSQVSATAVRPSFHSLSGLPYPSICLLIAAMHAQTAGHDIVTFEMLHETFQNQVRSSTSAPVEVEGGAVGMVRCTRDILKCAFEMLVASKVFVATAAPSATMACEFVRYRCVVERGDIKKATEEMGQTNLKKWLSKAH